jgi:hypothetical protein
MAECGLNDVDEQRKDTHTQKKENKREKKYGAMKFETLATGKIKDYSLKSRCIPGLMSLMALFLISKLCIRVQPNFLLRGLPNFNGKGAKINFL